MDINNLEVFLNTISSGKLALGCCITFSDAAVSEMAADSGFDFLWIDGEHGEMDRHTAMLHLMAVRGTRCASFYRVPACNHTEIKRIIDYAPAGVIVPMIMNEKDAELAVSACRYPLEGTRGCGFRRGFHYGNAEFESYWETAKHDPMVILQMEHIEAVRNIDKILAVPGVDSLLIGPYDLSASMGKEGQFHDPEVCAALDLICKKCRAAGKLLGAYTEGDFELWKARGVQYICCANDTSAMLTGFRSMTKKVRDVFEQK